MHRACIKVTFTHTADPQSQSSHCEHSAWETSWRRTSLLYCAVARYTSNKYFTFQRFMLKMSRFPFCTLRGAHQYEDCSGNTSYMQFKQLLWLPFQGLLLIEWLLTAVNRLINSLKTPLYLFFFHFLN